jgi:hypothetical protein
MGGQYAGMAADMQFITLLPEIKMAATKPEVVIVDCIE